MKDGLLVLANGLVMKGEAIGGQGTAVGELVFNTAISGYQEIISDPSYCQQVVTLTYPHIGNVGTNADDDECARCWAAGLVVRQASQVASNWRSQQSLTDYLIKNNIIAISGVDTRHLTHQIREQGAQSVCITTELTAEEALMRAKGFSGLTGLDLAQTVTIPNTYQFATGKKAHVVVYDFGVKRNILRLLAEQDLSVTVVNAKTSLEHVLELKPDGILLSNGPGDPSACDYAIESAKALLAKKIPTFGICLGFQILAIALGAKTCKMKFGHHGGNHPVIDLETKKIAITSQNHGFMVDEKSLPSNVLITHRSLFDNTIQGIAAGSAIGFQGHPEAAPGPNDIQVIFENFVSLMVD